MSERKKRRNEAREVVEVVVAGADEGERRKNKKVKISRQQKKQWQRDELAAKKVGKKLQARALKEELDTSLASGVCVTLGRMAYDLARSGTREHLDELISALPFLLPEPHSSNKRYSSLSLEGRVKQALLFGETAYLLALSG